MSLVMQCPYCGATIPRMRLCPKCLVVPVQEWTTDERADLHRTIANLTRDLPGYNTPLPPVEEPPPEPLTVEEQERLIATLATDERFRKALRGVLGVK